MPAAAPIVLVDLTVLATETRVRGIGRYVAELGPALQDALAADRGSSPLRLRFLQSVGFDGRAVIGEDAREAVEALMHSPELSRWGWAYRLRLGAARAARRLGAALLHLPHAGATPLGLGLVRRLVTCHDLICLRYPDRYLDWRDGWGPGRRLLDRRRFGMADQVLAISQATANDLQTMLGVGAERVTVVHHGIDGARWHAAPDEHDAGHLAALGVEPPYLFCVGDADWRKNAGGICAAVGRARRRGMQLRLVWAGQLDDHCALALRRQAVVHGVPLWLPGHVEDAALHALYRGALGTLFVSRAEGFGYPLLEAMALGCPAITSSCSSLPEVAGGAALLVDPEQPDAIADAIVSLGDDEVRATLRERGIARAATASLRRQAQQTLALYRRVIVGG